MQAQKQTCPLIFPVVGPTSVGVGLPQRDRLEEGSVYPSEDRNIHTALQPTSRIPKPDSPQTHTPAMLGSHCFAGFPGVV